MLPSSTYACVSFQIGISSWLSLSFVSALLQHYPDGTEMSIALLSDWLPWRRYYFYSYFCSPQRGCVLHTVTVSIHYSFSFPNYHRYLFLRSTSPPLSSSSNELAQPISSLSSASSTKLRITVFMTLVSDIAIHSTHPKLKAIIFKSKKIRLWFPDIYMQDDCVNFIIS